jgi:hypothetical protein
MGIHLATKRLNIKSLTHLSSISPSPSAHKLGNRDTEPKPNPKDQKLKTHSLKLKAGRASLSF